MWLLIAIMVAAHGEPNVMAFPKPFTALDTCQQALVANEANINKLKADQKVEMRVEFKCIEWK